MLATVALLLQVSTSSPAVFELPAFRYERRGGQWIRHENGLEYPVDPRVVSARFALPAAGVAALVESWQGELAGLRVVRRNSLGVADLEIPAGADPLAVVAALRATGHCVFAEENTLGHHHFIPNDVSFGDQWNLNNTGQGGGTPDADVDAPEAWDVEDGDPSIVIAVVDSGADDTHPDLAASIWTNPGQRSSTASTTTTNGFIDDIRGWDFVDERQRPASGNTGPRHQRWPASPGPWRTTGSNLGRAWPVARWTVPAAAS